MSVTLRMAAAGDVDTILDLIVRLAVYEKEPNAVHTTREDLLRDGFGERPYFECLLAEQDGVAVGMALFFPNYSTWEGHPGLYLEDLYVDDSVRGQGVGRLIMARLAAICRERGYKRLDLAVLDWNDLARGFYEHLEMIEQKTWQIFRLTGAPLERLASEA